MAKKIKKIKKINKTGEVSNLFNLRFQRRGFRGLATVLHLGELLFFLDEGGIRIFPRRVGLASRLKCELAAGQE